MKKKFDKKAYLKSYYDMLLWRKFEEKCAALYIQQKMMSNKFPTKKSFLNEMTKIISQG